MIGHVARSGLIGLALFFAALLALMTGAVYAQAKPAGPAITVYQTPT